MAFLIETSEHGFSGLGLDYEEALSLLALLNANPGYWNRNLRRVLGEYIDRIKPEQ